ncbi:MAG: hypothetical protein AB7N76_12750 [Planctomycetota bacterium]
MGTFFYPAPSTRPSLSPMGGAARLLLVIAALLAVGCSVSVFSQDRKRVLKDKDGNLIKDKDGNAIVEDYEEIYTVVRDPEEAFAIIAKDLHVDTDFKGELPKPAGAISVVVSSSVGLETVMLAQQLDQINSQVRAQFKAALFGLNSNPTSLENQDRFWKSIDDVNRQMADLRKVTVR